MVVCIVAFIVFSILGIVSGHYRGLAKDAFKCVFLMVQFKPCDVELETKIKTKITSKLMVIPSLARFFYKYFKPISWAFTVSFFVSLAYSAYGIYNLIVYGSCDPNSATCGVNQFLQIVACYEIQLVSLIIVVAIILFAYFMIKKKNIKFVFE